MRKIGTAATNIHQYDVLVDDKGEVFVLKTNGGDFLNPLMPRWGRDTPRPSSWEEVRGMSGGYAPTPAWAKPPLAGARVRERAYYAPTPAWAKPPLAGARVRERATVGAGAVVDERAYVGKGAVVK